MSQLLRHVRYALFSAYLMNLWRGIDGDELAADLSSIEFFRLASINRIRHYPQIGMGFMDPKQPATVSRQFDRLPLPTDPMADVAMAASAYFEAFPPVTDDIDVSVVRNAIMRLAYLTRAHARKICEIFASIVRAKQPYATSAIIAAKISSLEFTEIYPGQIHPFVSDCLRAAGVGPVDHDLQPILAISSWRESRCGFRVDMIYYDAFFGRGPGAFPRVEDTMRTIVRDITQGRLIALPGVLPMEKAKRLAESGVTWSGKIAICAPRRYDPRSVADPSSPPVAVVSLVDEEDDSSSLHLCMCEGAEIDTCPLCRVSPKRGRYTGGESSIGSHSTND